MDLLHLVVLVDQQHLVDPVDPYYQQDLVDLLDHELLGDPADLADLLRQLILEYLVHQQDLVDQQHLMDLADQLNQPHLVDLVDL